MGGSDRDRLSGTEAFGAVYHDLGSRSRTAVEDRVLAFSQCDLDRLHLRDVTAFAVIVHGPDKKRTIEAGLDGRRRNNEGVCPVFEHQMDVYELVREEDRIAVPEYRLEFACACGGIDLVIGGEQTSLGKKLCVTAVVGVNRHPLIRR